jgi:hypothetical protein
MESLTNLTNLLSDTNLVNQLSSLQPNEVESIAKNLFSQYGWMFAAGVGVFLIKDVMMNFAKGIIVFYGSHFNNDDIIYISGRQARIVRVGITSTTFYMTDRKSKMVVPNEQLKELTIEKTLPLNGGDPYLPKGGDPDFNPTKK